MIPISALSGNGVEIVLQRFIAALPEGPPLYPDDHFTEQPERFLAAEIAVREKAMAATIQEVPQAVGVLVESYEESDKLIRISARYPGRARGTERHPNRTRWREAKGDTGTLGATWSWRSFSALRYFSSYWSRWTLYWRSDPRRQRMTIGGYQIEEMSGGEE